ncbi:uncharacterized protein LOC114402334 [Glycine soja]|uniref:uncharacterized protein LOC114402334 n=1 Tax=Glycine soja TaxID=3848 RepID=UPI00103D055D|nr:uncharacterized protein LOC114402334 [Glycine soja]KAG4909060.1 hypothetical protein JHK87_055176 [Glycine soja]
MAQNNFWHIFCETRNIFQAHSRHLVTLSLIFLFPLSFSLLLSPTLSNLFNHFYTNIIPYPYNYSSTTNPNYKHHSLFFHLLYSLFTFIFSNCGVISITYSVFHFFNDQSLNLNLKSTITKSISTSFLPLLATTIVSHVIIFFVSLLYALLLVLIICGAIFFNVTTSYSSLYYFIGFLIALPLLFFLIYLQVNWTLVPVIVILESCWGLEALKRSARLVRGMKRVALSSLFVYGFFEVIVVLNGLLVTKDLNGTSDGWVLVVSYWVFIVSQSYFVAVCMVSKIAFNTVLYAYCKPNHGEVIVEEFEKEGLIGLPFHDDGKVSNAV